MTAQMEAYAIEQALLRARLLYVTSGISPGEIEDARQELLPDFLRRSPKFDSERGDWGGFVRGVMRNQATVLIARRFQRVRREVLADDLRAGMDGSVNVLETIQATDITRALQLSLDVQRVLHRLPRHLQRLASLLVDSPVAEVCTTIGKSRSRTYQMIREIRSAFVTAGLDPGGARPLALGREPHRNYGRPRRQDARGQAHA